MIQFSDTTHYKGLVQLYEQELGFELGYISGNETRLKQFTARVNLALDRYFAIAIQASGTWQLDDNNHTKYPIIKTDLVLGQRSYTFLTDEQGNVILDIYKVFIKDEAGLYREIYPVDVQTQTGTEGFTDGQDQTGLPYRYEKTANGIFLDFIPSYNSSNGLKVYVNRESSYFTYQDTAKTPGYPYHQEYFFLKPAFDDARINSRAGFARLEAEMLKLEGDTTSGRVGLIAKAYGNRRKDEQQVITTEPINSI